MSQDYHNLVILLSRGISQRRMYYEDHPRVHGCASQFCQTLEVLLEKDRKSKFFIGVANGKLIHEGKYLIGPSIIGSRLNTFADFLGSGGFLFNRGVETQEVQVFFTLAAAQNKKLDRLTEAREMIKNKGITNIELSPPYEDAGWFGQFLFEQKDNAAPNSGNGEEWDQLLPTFQSLYSTVEAAHEAGQSGRGLEMDEARTTSEKLMQAANGRVQDILQLVRYPDYDTYTVGHSVRVAMFAVMVGKHLELPAELLNELGAAALLHDVGKSRIPVDILFKPGRLDERERAIMETHASLGAEMLLESPGASTMAIAAAWGHHRRFDSNGYPHMTLGSKESSFTRIINVCDVYEALTAIRPYKKAHTSRKAFEIMLSDQSWFCPMALNAFCGAIGMYPAGSLVRLTSGHRALVLEPGEIFDRPQVKLTHGPEGKGLPEEAQHEVDLSTHPSRVAVDEQLVVV